MREFVVQRDKLRGTLFNEKEIVLYNRWFAEYMKGTLDPYMKSVYDENVQWVPLAAINASFENWISQHMEFNEQGNYAKYFHEDITVFGGPLGKCMSCNQLIFLLLDHVPSLYMLDEMSRIRADIYDHISFWSVFVPTYHGS